MDEHTYDEATEAAMERDLRTLAREALPDEGRGVQAIRDEAAAIPSQWRGLEAPRIAPPRRRASRAAGIMAALGILSFTVVAYAAHRSFQSPPRAEPAAVAVVMPHEPAARPEHAPVVSEPEAVVAPPEVAPQTTPARALDTHAPAARPAARDRARVVPSETHHVAPALAAPAPTPSAALDRTLEQLLDGALGERPASSPSPALPLVPTQASVRSTLRALERRVDACAEGSTGIAIASFEIEGSSGRVRQVNVSGVGAAEAECIERIVADARFERFSQSELSVSFPYRVR